VVGLGATAQIERAEARRGGLEPRGKSPGGLAQYFRGGLFLLRQAAAQLQRGTARQRLAGREACVHLGRAGRSGRFQHEGARGAGLDQQSHRPAMQFRLEAQRGLEMKRRQENGGEHGQGIPQPARAMGGIAS